MGKIHVIIMVKKLLKAHQSVVSMLSFLMYMKQQSTGTFPAITLVNYKVTKYLPLKVVESQDDCS